MAKREEDKQLVLPLVWIEPESVEIAFVNQMVVQRQADEYVLTFGQQTPPMLSGTPDEQLEQAEQLRYVPVRTAVRIGMTTQRLKEFVKVIQGFVERQDQTEGRTDDEI